MEEWEVHKVKLSELEDFFNNMAITPHSVLPISRPRVSSYINNPKSSPSDTVLYYIENENEIIAFRTVWADTVQSNGQTVKFGWCSGNWVKPILRRKGLSTLLLNEAFADWNGKLMFTNYAPESEAGNLKSGLFTNAHKRTGLRFYFNANLNEIFAQRNKSSIKKLAIGIANAAYRQIFNLKRVFFTPHSFNGYKIEVEKNFSNQLSFSSQPSVFGRKATDFQWIFNFPWLENDVNDQTNYQFSWKTKAFGYTFVTIKNSSEPVCSFVISERMGAVKLLYWQSATNDNVLIAKWIANYCHLGKVKTLTVIDPEMALTVKNLRNPFVLSKHFTMNIYSTFEFDSTNNKIFDGDGDYIFT